MPSGLPHKRAISDPDDVHSCLKHGRFGAEAPSNIAIPEHYEKLQNDPSQKILDDCPTVDHGIPPVSLLYSGFGHFLDIMKGHEDVPGLTDVNVAELQVTVDKLAMEMAEFEPNELCGRDIQREIGLIQINAAFRAR